MKLGLKIILPIFVLLVVVTGAFGYILYNLEQQETVISTEGAKIRTLNGLNERLAREQDQTEYYVLAYRFDQDGSSLLAISQAELEKSKTLDKMFPFIATVRGRELINSYIDARKEIEYLRNDLIEAIDEGDEEQITLQYNKWNIQTQNIKAALADIGAYNINSLEKTLATVGDIRNKIFGIITILLLVIIATILFLYFYLKTVITTPIIKLAEFADEISRQNFTTTTTTTTTRKDELGVLSRAFNTMVVKLKESYTILEQKVRDRTQALDVKVQELERTNKLMVGRELKMVELKKEIEKLKELNNV
jgi:HAMP domain-containing protein